MRKHGFNNILGRAKYNFSTPFSVSGVKWVIHNHDDDINNPSCPHMHAMRKPWKLDLYTGDIHDINIRKIVDSIKGKDLKRIWKVNGVFKIIVDERARYEKIRKQNPKRYPELPPMLISNKDAKVFKSVRGDIIKHKNQMMKGSYSIIIEITPVRIKAIMCKRK